MPLKFLTLMLAAGTAVAACSDEGAGFTPTDEVQIRAINVAPGAPALDLLLADSQIADNLVYGQSTTYQTVTGGDQVLRVNSDFGGQNQELLTIPTPLTPGATYTVVISGSAETLIPFVLPDDNTAPPTGQAKFRAMHWAQSAEVVDVYVTAPGADLTTATTTFASVSYGTATSYATVPAGTYQVRVTRTGTQEVLVDSGPVLLSEGDVRTAVAIESPSGGAPYSAVLLDDH